MSSQKKNPSTLFNRRDFVKSSAMVMGGLMASQLPIISAKAYAGGSDVIKIGLIGCGGRGTGAAAQALSTHQSVKLVAMGDAFRDRLDQSYKNLSNQEYPDYTGKGTANIKDRIDVPESNKFVGFDAYKEVLKLCDVVLIATPPGFRPIHFEAAVAAGKQIFMEKPVATDAPGIRRVLAAAEEAKKKKLNVVVGLQRHYQDIYRQWVGHLHGGAIGDIHTAHVYWNSDGVWVKPREAKQTEMEYQMRNWYYFNWLCGDHIVEQHVHNLDVGNWVFEGYPVRAHGMGGRQVRNGKEYGEIFDHFAIEYEFANGQRMFSQCRHIKGCMNRVSEAFQGSSGFAPKPGVINTAKGHTIWEYKSREQADPYQVEHDELFAAIAAGEYKFADAENGAKSTMTAILGRMAAYSGKMVEWEDAINSEHSIMPKTFAWDAQPPVLPDKNGFYPIPVPGQTEAR
ncbi:MAG: Gfo/Idh/MocA family oxidoreductase [Bacteroidia bacterium]